MSQLAIAFWRTFEERTGARHDFHERGYLFIANTTEGVAQLRRPMALYERLHVPVEMLGRVEIAELVPRMRVDDLAGGRFCARDGYGDPLVALAGFAGAAQLGGARFKEGAPVEALLREGDRVTGVHTASGDVSAWLYVHSDIVFLVGASSADLAAEALAALP